MKGFGVIEVVIVIMVVGILLSIVAVSAMTANSSVPCSKYASWPLKDVPARCASFFQTQP